jgi:hypothetical protein
MGRKMTQIQSQIAVVRDSDGIYTFGKERKRILEARSGEGLLNWIDKVAMVQVTRQCHDRGTEWRVI